MEPRETFDEAAELYDRARPGYPAELFDDLVALAELPGGSMGSSTCSSVSAGSTVSGY